MRDEEWFFISVVSVLFKNFSGEEEK